MMTIASRLDLARVVERAVLAGRAPGERDRPKIAEAVANARGPGLLLIDLVNVAVITSSYFDASLWWIWTSSPADLYPVLLNLSPEGADDVLLVLKGVGAAVWTADLANEDTADIRPTLLGELDGPLITTIRAVVERGEVTAPDLLSLDASIGPTAWSNRLAYLYQIRLVKRRKDGRRLIYSASWSG